MVLENLQNVRIGHRRLLPGDLAAEPGLIRDARIERTSARPKGRNAIPARTWPALPAPLWRSRHTSRHCVGPLVK
jgi:hypothetical protein